MSTVAGLMTVEQFRNLEDPPGAYYELRHGELAIVTRPKWKHGRVQSVLRDTLNALAGPLGRAESEFAFRPLPEHELPVADVVYIEAGRYQAMSEQDNLRGSPELVVEVLSPSNTKREIAEKASLCLNTGSVEFWVIDPDLRTVVVYTSAERAEYAEDGLVPVDRFLPGRRPIPVTRIFSDPLAAT